MSFLNWRMQHKRSAGKLRFLIRRTERKVDGEFTSDTMKGITFKAILPNGSEFDQDKLSFGQKRMLTFLWYAAANEHGPIIVDELANGLHHAWIQKCFEVIGERQAFLSTQNPLILDFLDFTSAEHTARSMVRCEVGERGWRWGNLNTEEAERLYRACQANFMHVSEILRSEGLW
ncbi:MAG: ATP-binding protein [Deltaproteobacteria bacterium]|nr:ATP-binding protein [Deltaproteobacteria bacterium]